MESATILVSNDRATCMLSGPRGALERGSSGLGDPAMRPRLGTIGKLWPAIVDVLRKSRIFVGLMGRCWSIRQDANSLSNGFIERWIRSVEKIPQQCSFQIFRVEWGVQLLFIFPVLLLIVEYATNRSESMPFHE